MHQSHVPQYTIQNGALWDICQLYFKNCEMGPCWLLKYHECNMNYEILSYKYPYIYLLTTLQWNTLNSMEPIDIYMVKKWSLFIKKITVAYQVKEQNYSLNDFPSVKYNPWVSCWGWPLSSVCTNVNGCVCDLNFANVSENDSVPNT